MNPKLIEKLAITFELCNGTELSKPAKALIVSDLDSYPEVALSAALDRCRAEVKGRLAPADIIQRIDDGRPGPEEAWALIPHSEHASVCWTREMAEAYGVCCSLVGNDNIAARMAFLEAYKKSVQDAKAKHRLVKWEVSFGFSKSERKPCVEAALLEGKIDKGTAIALCYDIDVDKLLGDGKSEVDSIAGSLSDGMTIK